MSELTIQQAIEKYLRVIESSRSKNTYQTYRFAMQAFQNLLADNQIDPQETPVSALREEAVSGFAEALKTLAPASERLYLQAVMGFYRFLAAEQLASPALPRLQQIIKLRARKTGQRLPQFPREAIEQVLKEMQNGEWRMQNVECRIQNGEAEADGKTDAEADVEADEKTDVAAKAKTDRRKSSPNTHSEAERLRFLRDRAFLLTLADTGLRVHEACKLRRGDIDWNEGRALLIGKGDKQDVVRFSRRALQALREYLEARARLDGASGRPLASLPLFARHDKGAGRKVKPMTTAAGRLIVEERVREILGAAFDGKITPHSFRHYFVTTVLRASGNLKLAQALARHANITVTQRYAHLSDDELDRGYHEIFESGGASPSVTTTKPA